MAAFIGKASASVFQILQSLLFPILDLPNVYFLGREKTESQGRREVEVSISKLPI